MYALKSTSLRDILYTLPGAYHFWEYEDQLDQASCSPNQKLTDEFNMRIQHYNSELCLYLCTKQIRLQKITKEEQV